MPLASSIFLIAALVLAVVFGPQTRAWSWGPAMMALSICLLAAIPATWKKDKAQTDFGIVIMAMITAGWFAWRAMNSPVAEFGHADLLLLTGAVGAFIATRTTAGNPVAEKSLEWGIALLLLASVVVVGMQLADPSFSPMFGPKQINRPTAFHAHYNETANFFIATSLMVAGVAMFGKHPTATRVIWLLLAAAGLVCVWLTRSRGGIFGAAVGLAVFAVMALMVGKRRNAKWFAPAVIAIPLIAIAVTTYWIMGWQEAQAARGGEGRIEEVLDNDCRLYFLGMALTCIGLHPLTGGGSRSFSWESFQFIDGKAQGGIITHRPELVHNELVQAATDYGLIGSGLLVGLLAAMVLMVVLRVLFEERPAQACPQDAWRIGGLAALAGMLVQSSFSFVFHLMPGIVLLGICLGWISRTTGKPNGRALMANRILLTLTAAGCLCILAPAAWKGVRVSRILWPVYFNAGQPVADESRAEAIGDAIRIWPQAAFYQERGRIYQKLAAASVDGPGFREYADWAIADYAAGARLHPYEPDLPVNRANLLSLSGMDTEAEDAYQTAIRLQGGMEPAFRGHFSLANHHRRKAARQLADGDVDAALRSIESAAREMDRAIAKMHWGTSDMKEPHIAILESLGTLRFDSGDLQGALAAYDSAAAVYGNIRAHYLAGVALGKEAVARWKMRKPEEALTLFIQARNRLNQAGGQLPPGVTPAQRTEYITYLDRNIAFLRGAKVKEAR